MKAWRLVPGSFYLRHLSDNLRRPEGTIDGGGEVSYWDSGSGQNHIQVGDGFGNGLGRFFEETKESE